MCHRLQAPFSDEITVRLKPVMDKVRCCSTPTQLQDIDDPSDARGKGTLS